MVIEIKWSHDGRVRRALREQLAKDYLVGEGRSHGLYVVGMTRSETHSARLLGDLRARRDECVREHPALTIDLVALQCQWSDDEQSIAPAEQGARSRSASSRRTKKIAVRRKVPATRTTATKVQVKAKTKAKARSKSAATAKPTKKSRKPPRVTTDRRRSPRG
ncbi:MAG: hypothetical protein KIS78_27535 [Labilithrix sp.]|nr:hypothetical protein [Labilithrix sp.]